MHDRLQAREISVVRVSLHEAQVQALVHIAQCRYLESPLIVWRQLQPSLIYRGRLAEQMPFGEKIADAAIDKCRSGRIGDIAQWIGPIFRIVRKPRVRRGSDVAGSEVGEQRVLAGPAVAVTGVALRLSAEQVVACLLLFRKLRLAGEYRVELRGKRRHLGRGL